MRVIESLTCVAAGAVVRRVKEYNQLWTLEIPRELKDILKDTWYKRQVEIQLQWCRYKYMERKQQERDKIVEGWEQFVEAGQEVVKQTEKV